MAALRRDAPTKSFFSNPSNTLKRLVNGFPKSQKLSLAQLSPSKFSGEKQRFLPKFAVRACDDEETCDNQREVRQVDVVNRSDGECVLISSSSAVEDAETDVVAGIEDDTDYGSSGEDEYPRPRIRPDLLPYDFSASQKSPSVASSTSRDVDTFSEVLSSSPSQERYVSQHGLVSHTRKPRLSLQGQCVSECNFMENGINTAASELWREPSPSTSSPPVDLDIHNVPSKLPDFKLGIVPAALKGISNQCRTIQSIASEDGRRNSVNESYQPRRSVIGPPVTASRVQDLTQVGPTLHQNIGDTAPFSESFRDDWDDGYHRNNFQHHASMVYTRAPSREALMKKVADATNAKRVSRNPKKLKKKSTATLEDQETEQLQTRGPYLSCSPRRVSYENAVDIAKLQGQVEELQRKLSITESVLQSHHSESAPKPKCSEMIFLKRKLEEVENKISEKDSLLELAQETIMLKENEIQEMQRHIREAEKIYAASSSRSADADREVMTLRCEVAALRWQIEVEAERTRCDIKALENAKELHYSPAGEEKAEREIANAEVMRRRYHAALVVARICPREECLALVRILRIQLQCLVKIPTTRLL